MTAKRGPLSYAGFRGSFALSIARTRARNEKAPETSGAITLTWLSPLKLSDRYSISRDIFGERANAPRIASLGLLHQIEEVFGEHADAIETVGIGFSLQERL